MTFFRCFAFSLGGKSGDEKSLVQTKRNGEGSKRSITVGEFAKCFQWGDYPALKC